MIEDATVPVVENGLDWKSEELECACWRQDGEARDLTLKCYGKKYDIKYVP